MLPGLRVGLSPSTWIHYPQSLQGPSTDGSEFYSVTYNGTVLLGVVSSAGIIVKLTVPPAPVQPQVAACFDLSTYVFSKARTPPKRTSIIVGPRRTKPMATARLPDGTLIHLLLTIRLSGMDGL